MSLYCDRQQPHESNDMRQTVGSEPFRSWNFPLPRQWQTFAGWISGKVDPAEGCKLCIPQLLITLWSGVPSN